MPLIILGVIFAVSLGIYWFFASRAIAEEDKRIEGKKASSVEGGTENGENDRSEGKVIFLSADLEREKRRHKKKN